ncbi:hypothetical protein PR048_024936 [Dryococelus australis]|uniref:Uncharacterized protein n=1 Tax=Dryococelus australis TaxID=614101 RepID=A0ABQ9GPY6_9NEOP|nr:hypothetical protein PR048_024936 [Dryococelus australis]
MQRKQKRRIRRNLVKNRAANELSRMLKAQEISGQYKNFTRMSPTTFEVLLIRIVPKICEKETHVREPNPAQDLFAVTLRFLATGDSCTSLQYVFRISKQAIGEIVRDVCAALVEVSQENIKSTEMNAIGDCGLPASAKDLGVNLTVRLFLRHLIA